MTDGELKLANMLWLGHRMGCYECRETYETIDHGYGFTSLKEVIHRCEEGRKLEQEASND